MMWYKYMVKYRDNVLYPSMMHVLDSSRKILICLNKDTLLFTVTLVGSDKFVLIYITSI